MQVFKDAKDRVWEISVNVGSVKRVRDIMKIDLTKSTKSDDENSETVLMGILNDPIRLTDVVWNLISKQAEQKSISYDDFTDAIFGDVLESMAYAFAGAMADFFPNPRLRGIMHQKLQQAKAESVLEQNKMLSEISSPNVMQ